MEYMEPDPYDDEYYASRINTKVCKRCGEEDLHWVDIDGVNGEFTGKPKWRLHNDNGEVHVCQRKGA
jgi:hypothetical protein